MEINKVAIIIVNWNGKKFLKDCIDAIRKQSFKYYNIYLVDNGSNDDTISYVNEYFKEVKLIELSINTGFAKGNNIGIFEALKDSEVNNIVCLNNDTIVSDTWLEELIKTSNLDQSIGMVSSKAFFTTGEVQNAGLSLEKALNINKLGGISICYGKNDDILINDMEIFAPGGVAVLFKREMLEEIYKRDKEFFDEDYFAYAEDLDIGFRGRLLGWKCFLSVNARLIHLHSMTGGVASNFKAFYSERNTLLTAFKNLPFLIFVKFCFNNIFLKISYLDKKNCSVEKLKNNLGIFKMIMLLLKAHFSFLFLLPKFLVKRYKIQSTKKVTNKMIRNWFKIYSRRSIEYGK